MNATDKRTKEQKIMDTFFSVKSSDRKDSLNLKKKKNVPAKAKVTFFVAIKNSLGFLMVFLSIIHVREISNSARIHDKFYLLILMSAESIQKQQ